MIAALLRRAGWRLVFTAAGGIDVEGPLPAGPCVVVANHTSHADTAALLAAIPARRRPVVAAAADYWFAGRFRSLVCRALVSGFPVRRSRGGFADLATAAGPLAHGRTVIVFPEGTRSRDGQVGPFRSGAARLADLAGVPLVPAGIVGTRDLLAVHGRPRRGRLLVRFGGPETDLQVARGAVCRLSAQHDAETSGARRHDTARRVTTPHRAAVSGDRIRCHLHIRAMTWLSSTPAVSTGWTQPVLAAAWPTVARTATIVMTSRYGVCLTGWNPWRA